MDAGTQNRVDEDFSAYYRKIVNNLGYFAITRSRVGTRKGSKYEYYLKDTSCVARGIFYLFYCNTAIKAIFLAFLITNYFGPVEFLDKIAALDYILCVGIVTFGSCIWFFRYPLHEILHSFWKIENSIFATLGYPKDLKALIDKRHRATVWIHLFIVWFGCSILVTQFYADPKYCVWTYSAFQLDTWYLRIIFCLHEFFFMMHPWNNMTGSSSLCTFQGIALSNVIDRMTDALERMPRQNIGLNKAIDIHNVAPFSLNKNNMDYRKSWKDEWKQTVVKSKSSSQYCVNKMIFDYQQLMLITERFNSWVSYKIVFLHACGYSQFISDVFVGLQILKLEGTGITDVWFYIEDSLASMYMIYRVYNFMSRVKPASNKFLRALQDHIAGIVDLKSRKRLLKVTKTLRPVSLRLGPCAVTPETVLQALEMLSSYYLCVALWQ